MKTYVHSWSYLAQFFLEWEISQANLVEEDKTRIRKSCILWDNMENFNRGGEATVDNMAHAHCMLDA